MFKKNGFYFYIMSWLMIVSSLAALMFLPDLLGIINPPHSELIGVITDAEGDIRIRFGDSINWRTAKKNDQVYSQSYIFTGEKSKVHYRLIDDSSISVGENSMIYIGAVKDNNNIEAQGMSLELIEGTMQASLSENSDVKQIMAEDTSVNFDGHQKLLVQFDYAEDKDAKVYVFNGDVTVKRNNNTHKLKSGEKASLSEENPEPEVAQLSPIDVDKMIKEEEAKRKENLADIQKRRQIRFLLNSFFSFFTGN